MANSNFATGGILGVAIGTSTTDAKVAVGTRAEGRNGSEFVYVQANGAITGPGYVCYMDALNQAYMLSTANDARGNLVAVAVVAMADDEYGWLQVKGPALVQVGASCAANVRLNATATPGQIDDDGTTLAFSIDGIVLTTARAASAGTAPGMLNYPAVGAVL